MYPYVRDKLGLYIAPFRWESARRRKLEVLLNVIAAYYYGMDEYDLDYIMDQFLGVRRDEEAQYGSFRLKDEILQVFSCIKDLAAGELSSLYRYLECQPAHESQRHRFPSRAEAESKMPWIDWSSLPN